MNSILEYLANCSNSYPDKTAVAYQSERISFFELEHSARKLARAIPEDIRSKPVAVLAERSIHTIVCFMAVVFSGNYYVPIDPELPTAKLGAIFADAEFSVVLGSSKTRKRLESIDYSGVFLSENDFSQEECSYPQLCKESALYMIYTSGSTGMPKGVLKSHEAVISFIEAYDKTFNFSQTEIIGNQTPFFFDASAKDLYLMLKKGVTLEIIPTQYFAMPTSLISYLNEKNITYISWVPTALSIVSQLNTFSYIKPQTLKKVFFVGEVMAMKQLNRWRTALPDLQYVNLYGASELAGICCYYEVMGTFSDSEVLPIGKPLMNCRLYLLDGDTVVSEPDRIGELYIASSALATAYFHDAQKTENSFMYKDFGQGKIRCFKTGDLARYDNAGNLVFASRADYQIKHMGYRIELGEIEAVANSLPQLTACCCLYHKEKSQIVLFCQLSESAFIKNKQELLHALKPKLSSYMLPNRIVMLEKLPLNANGKIDRQQLKTLL